MRSKYRIFFATCPYCGDIGAALCPSMVKEMEEMHREAHHNTIYIGHIQIEV